MTGPVKYAVGFVVGLLLLGILIIPAYAIVVSLAMLLPPILVVQTFKGAYEQGELTRVDKIGMRLFLALIALPAIMLTFAAPLRTLLVGATSFYPPALHRFHEAHEFLYQPVNALAGELAPYWIDLYWGGGATLVIFVLALGDMVRRNMLVSQIRNLSTSRVRSAAIGFVELSGTAVPFRSGAAAPIIRSWVEKTGGLHSTKTEIRPFYLDDGTGRILVDATGASVDADKVAFFVDLHQVRLRQHVVEDGLPEGRLMPGDPVFLVGSVQINDDRTLKAEEPVVIKPKKFSILHPNFYDLFFLSAGGEKQQLEALARSVSRGWMGIMLLMLVTAWLAINAWTNIRQVEDLDLDAVSPLFRVVSAPSLMERRVVVPGMGTHTTARWLQALRQPGGDKNHIMERLKQAHVAHLAVPILLERAGDIDHRDFWLSNHWLMTLKALPPGQWGYEYFSKRQEAASETQVFRVMIRRAGDRLIASCDAYFNEGRTKRAVVARKLVFVFRNAATGSTRSAEIPAAPGWNKVRGAVLLETFSSGQYRVRISAKREFDGGFYDEQVWMAPEINMDLR